MAAVPVSHVAYVMSQESSAVCYLPHGLLHGPYHASLLRLLRIHLHTICPQSMLADRTKFAQQCSLLEQKVIEYRLPVYVYMLAAGAQVSEAFKAGSICLVAGTGQSRGLDADGARLALQSLVHPSANPQIRAWQQARSVHLCTM